MPRDSRKILWPCNQSRRNLPAEFLPERKELALLLEQVLEGLARVVRPTRRERWTGSRSRLEGGRGCVLLDSHAKLVELAVVLCIFGGDAFRDRLRALELGSGIEETALLAAVQLEFAARARPVRIKAGC